MKSALLLGLAAAAGASYFADDFSKGDSWIRSTAKGDDAGKLELAPRKYGDAKDKGLKTTQDAKFYQAAAKFPKFSNKGKDLIVQYSVAHEQNIDCGGGYIKLLPEASAADLTSFNGDTEYNIMFGPDVCGSSKRTHFIVNYKGTNHLIKKDIPMTNDDEAHLYTLKLKKDNTFQVLIDGEEKSAGKLSDSDLFDIIPPKEIPDPSESKPADWDDRRKIDDPEDEKPAGWDDIPATIADPDATKPDDWDDELDGSWEPPTIDNPEFKGEWKPKQIDNPAYKGEWKAKLIANPDYFTDDNLYAFNSFAGVGIEVWQVKSGTVFDDFLITDKESEADAALEKFKTRNAAEKEKRDAAKEEERKKAEEERKKAEAEAAEEGEEEEEEEEGKEEL